MKANGFTLVEMLVSLLIFSLLASAGVLLLSVSLDSGRAAEQRLGAVAGFRRTVALLTADLAQAAPRASRGVDGSPRPAFAAEGGAAARLVFLRGGWEEEEGASPSVRLVDYRLDSGRLVRLSAPHADGDAPSDPQLLLDRVDRIDLRFRDARGAWRSRWDPERPDRLPRAVEMTLVRQGTPPVVLALMVGPGS